MPDRTRFLTLLLVASSLLVAGCGEGGDAKPKDTGPTATEVLEAYVLSADNMPDDWKTTRDEPGADDNLDAIVLDCLEQGDLEPAEHVTGLNLHDAKDVSVVYSFANRWTADDLERLRDYEADGLRTCLAQLLGAKVEAQAMTPPIEGFEPFRLRLPDDRSMALGLTCEQRDCLWIHFAPALRDVRTREIAHALAAARARHAALVDAA